MRKKRERVWLHPTAIEQAYMRAARAYVRQIKADTDTVLVPQVAFIRSLAHDFRPDADDDVAAAAEGTYYAALTEAVNSLVRKIAQHSSNLWDLAKKFGADTVAFNDKQFHLGVRAAFGVDVFKSEPWLNAEIRTWEAENLRLIKSIPEQHVAKLQGVINEALRAGKPTSEIVKAIRAVSDVTQARAELIAQDQISKLNADLTKARQTGLGVTHARWSGVLDRRERPTHRALEGVVFSWKNPPLGGPGREYRCRCWATAIWPELAHIDGLIQP
ncbi:MAG: phage head morphosis protein family domain protein [Rhodoferax sp.]|nr:phage head morphosis protein family domain protein [Rhodoferax sp.]